MESPEAGVLGAFDELYEEMNRRNEVVVAVHTYATDTGILDIDLTDNNLLNMASYQVQTSVYGQNFADVKVEKMSVELARAYITDGKKLQSADNAAIAFDATGAGNELEILFQLIKVPVQISRTFAPDIDGGDQWIAGQGDLNFVPTVAVLDLDYKDPKKDGVLVSGAETSALLSFRYNGSLGRTKTVVVGSTSSLNQFEIESDAVHGDILTVTQTVNGEVSLPSVGIIVEREDATSIQTFALTVGEVTELVMAGTGAANLNGYSYSVNFSGATYNGTIAAGNSVAALDFGLNAVAIGASVSVTVTTPYGFTYTATTTVQEAAGGNAL
jgi:hypothetical protein